MEYIFIHAKKDVMTESNDRIKNSEEKRKKKIECKEMVFSRVLIHFFIYIKNLTCKKYCKNICDSLTCKEDLVKFYDVIPNTLLEIEFSFKKSLFDFNLL